MRSLAEIAEGTRAETKFRASRMDSSIVIFANECLLSALGRRATALRVRAGRVSGIEERYGRDWRTIVPSTSASPDRWARVVWCLKHMSNIRPGTQVVMGAKLAFGTARDGGPTFHADFDATWALTPTGDTIVLTGVPVSGESSTALDPVTLERVERSSAWLDEARAASDRSDRERVRRCLESAAADAVAVGRRNAARAAPILLRAGSIAHLAGLSEEAIALVRHAIGCGITSARGRVHADIFIAEALEALQRFDDARSHQERALASAEAFGVETGLLVYTLSAAARGCARAGDVARAGWMLDRARVIGDSLLGADSAFLTPRLELARLHRATDPFSARAALQQVLALAEAYGDEETIELALRELAEVELGQGQAAEAIEQLKRALALASSHPRALPIYTLLSRALGASDRHAEALAVLRAGVELARRSRRPDHPERVALESALALADRSLPYR